MLTRSDLKQELSSSLQVDFVNTPHLYKGPCHPRKIANLALWFVPEGAQSAWTLQETHRNSTNYARDEARTSKETNSLLNNL